MFIVLIDISLYGFLNIILSAIGGDGVDVMEVDR